MIEEALLNGGETELFLQYVGDLLSYLQVHVDRHRELIKRLKSQEHPGMEATLKHFDDKLVNRALQLILIADQQGDEETAQKIREIASNAVADPRLHTP